MTDTLKRPELPETGDSNEDSPRFGAGPFLQRGISSQSPEAQQRWREEMDRVRDALLEAPALDLSDEELEELVREEVETYRAEHPDSRTGSLDAPRRD